MERTPSSAQRRTALGRMAVGHDIGAVALGLLDRGADLGVAELHAVERVGGAGDAAGAHDLDLVRALAQLLAHRLAHLVGAVDHVAEPRPAALAQLAGAGEVARPAQVAVAAGLGQALAGVQQARAGGQAVLAAPAHSQRRSRRRRARW